MERKIPMQSDKLKGFIRHGFIIGGQNQSQAYGDCVFCGKENKFYISLISQLWDCKVCMKKGNYLSFLKEISQQNKQAMDAITLKRLATNRGLPTEAFKEWGIGRSEKGYTIPIFDAVGNLQDLRTYSLGKQLMSSPGCQVGLFGIQHLTKIKIEIPTYICEGEWDGIAMQWLLRKLNKPGVIVAVPGAGTFKREWIPQFRGRDVHVLYDNDNAGENGELTVKERLTGVAKSIKYLHWPVGLPDGYDLRDLISKEAVKSNRPIATFKKIQGMLVEKPRKKSLEELESPTDVKLEYKLDPNVTLDDVYAAFRKWLHIDSTDGILMALATVISNELEGDPVWLFLVAPPGGSKTEIMSTFDKYPNAYITSSLTPQSLISGASYKNGADPSIIPKLDGKTLIVKDFTSIMGKKETEKDEIFGILRDAYDGKCGKVFGNGVERHFESHFSVLSGVTPSIYELSGQYAGLGERFLKFFIGDNLEHKSEIEIIMRAMSNVNREKQMRDELSNVVLSFVTKVVSGMKQPSFKLPEVPQEMLHSLAGLAQWGARMRGVIGREKYQQDMITAKPSAEVGSRLGKQLIKILYAIVITVGKKQCTEAEFRLVRKTMLDTISQRSEDIFRMLFKSCATVDDSLSALDISHRTRYPHTTVRRVLDDMNLLGIVTRCGTLNKYSWTVSEKMRGLITKSALYSTEEEMKRPVHSIRRPVKFKRKVKR